MVKELYLRINLNLVMELRPNKLFLGVLKIFCWNKS